MKRTVAILSILLASGTGALAAVTINTGDYDRGDATKPRPDDSAIVINGWVEYDVTFEKTGCYILSAKYRHRGSKPITMKLNGERMTSKLCKIGADTETPWMSRQLFQVYIRQGQHVLRLEADHSPELRHLQFSPKRKDNGPTLARRLGYISDLLEDSLVAVQKLSSASEIEPIRKRVDSLKAKAAAIGPDEENPENWRSSRLLREDLHRLRWEIAGLRANAVPYAGQEVVLWPANPLRKVFKNDPLPGKADSHPAFIEACRNEYEPLQLCITSFDYEGPVKVEVGPLVHRSGKHRIGNVNARFVGSVPLHQQSWATDSRGIELPAMWPDPLILDEQVTLGPRQTQPVWITVKVPKDALPGDYDGEITVITEGGRLSTPVNLKVYPMVIPDETNFWLGGWGGENRQSIRLGLEPFSPEFFEFLEHTLVNRYDHRARTYSDEPVWNAFALIKVTWTGSGYTYDYTLWDKYISLVEQTYRGQFRVICVSFGAALADNRGGLVFSARVLNPDGSVNPEKSFDSVFPNEPGYLEFIGGFFVNMQEHLREKGWLEHVYFKVRDEINHGKAIEHFRIVGRHIKKVAPDIRQDATIGVPHMFGEEYIDLPIGVGGFFQKHAELYEKQAAKGREVWTYGNAGDIDFPELNGVRGVGWNAYRYGLKGYHRWAYAWIVNAWENTDFSTPSHAQPKIIAPGRDFVVYLDEKRKVLVDSIRWEMFRETAEDYELLLLAERAGLDSKSFCRQIVKKPYRYEPDPDRFYEVRHQLLAKLSELTE